jgi:hypothetical protein
MYRYVEVWTKPALAENAAARSADESHVRQFVERTTRIDGMSLRLDLPLIFMKFLIHGDGDVFMSLKIPELPLAYPAAPIVPSDWAFRDSAQLPGIRVRRLRIGGSEIAGSPFGSLWKCGPRFGPRFPSLAAPPPTEKRLDPTFSHSNT